MFHWSYIILSYEAWGFISPNYRIKKKIGSQALSIGTGEREAPLKRFDTFRFTPQLLISTDQRSNFYMIFDEKVREMNAKM